MAAGWVHQELTVDLTDRQRATLEAAAYSGFFEWPREATGEDVVESLEIAPPTFSQHLRKAQQKVFQSLFPLSTPACHEGVDLLNWTAMAVPVSIGWRFLSSTVTERSSGSRPPHVVDERWKRVDQGRSTNTPLARSYC